jgi:hypothetical protein
MLTRKCGRKWLLVSVIVAFVGGLVWIIVDAFRPLDMRAEISRSAVVAYGHVIAEHGQSRVVIEQIWKHSPSGHAPPIGSLVPSRLPVDAKPDSLILCFYPRHASPDAIIAVYGERVPAADMSLAEVKALCAARPGT